MGDEATAVAARAECESFQKKFVDVKHMQPASLQALLDAGRPLTLLDVRTKEERAVSMLPGALSLDDLAELKRRAAAPDAGPLITYCTVGYRSSLEARRLAADATVVPHAGVYSMAGILAWAHEGGALVDPSTGQPTRRLHLFGARWAQMAPDTHESVVFPARQQAANLLPIVGAVVRDWLSGTARAVVGAFGARTATDVTDPGECSEGR